MGTTYKVILDKRRAKANGEFPVKLRIFQDGDYRDFSPNVSVAEQYWDEENQRVVSSHPNCENLNSAIAAPKAKLATLLKLCELQQQPDPTLDEITHGLGKKPPTQKKSQKKSLLEYGLALAERMEKAGEVGNSIVYTTAINRLRKFVGSDKFGFADLTYTVLEEWNSTMVSEGLSVNAISNYMRTIRAIYNKGIKEGLTSITAYPFGQFRIRNKKTISKSLSVEEMKLIVTVNPQKPYQLPYRDLFLLSFCLIGMNFADLLTITPADVIDGRIVFHRKKTHKIYSIKIHPKAEELFRNLNAKGDGLYLLPFINKELKPVELKKKIMLVEHCVNDALKKIAVQCEIAKQISTYYARYAWANIAKKSCGYSKDMIAEALGHEYGNKVTGIYLDEYSSELIDEMNECVIKTVFA